MTSKEELYKKILSPETHEKEKATSLKELFEKGEYSNPEYWRAFAYTLENHKWSKNVSKELIPLVLEGYKKNAHTFPEYARVVESLSYDSPDHAKHIYLGLKEVGAHKHPWFWEILSRTVAEGIAPKELLPIIERGIYEGAHKHEGYWYTIQAALYPYGLTEGLEKAIKEGVRRGAHNYPIFWEAVRDVASIHPETARKMIPILIEGAKRGAHRQRTFWEAALTVAKYVREIPTEEVIRMVEELYDSGAHEHPGFWDLIEEISEHPEIAKRIPRILFEKNAARNPWYWGYLYSLSEMEHTKELPHNHPALALAKALNFYEEGAPPEKIATVLESHKDHKVVRPFYVIAKHHPEKLDNVLKDPMRAYVFAKIAQKLGNKNEKVAEIVGILHHLVEAEKLGIDTERLFTENLDEFERNVVEEIVKRKSKYWSHN